MASHQRGTLYAGVTGNMRLRAWEHRDGVAEGFTKRYEVKHLP
jgi:putative endonuclease